MNPDSARATKQNSSLANAGLFVANGLMNAVEI